MRPRLLVAIVLPICLLAAVVRAAPASEPGVGPLSPEARRLLAAVPADPRPKTIVRGNHYVVSNEDRPHLFHELVDGGGGVLLGVGAEQNYVFAGWARAELIFLMDFDQVVVDLHRVYALFFRAADAPDDFVAWWSPDRERRARRVLSRGASSKDDRRALMRAYRIARRSVYRRLRWLRGYARRTDTPNFVSDAGQYAHIAALVRAGRVVPVRGDLTKQGTLAAIGEALRTLGLPLRVLYLSNAEEYFLYNDAFRRSVSGLPAGERSVVLRTSPRDYDGFYRYSYQSLADFQTWLRREDVRKIRHIRRYKRRQGHRDRYWLPPPSEPSGSTEPE